jgi:hypothetical protein
MDNQYTEGLETTKHTIEHNSMTPGEIIIGELLGFNQSGEPQVHFPRSGAEGLSAISTVAITPEHTGRQVALLFANGDFSKPVIMGLIYSPLLDILNNVEFISETEPEIENNNDDVFDDSKKVQNIVKQDDSNTAFVDGNRVVLEGKEEIVLKCGEASITLTKAGKILIRGKYLLNRSSGVNRIMGGSVQVN